MRPGHGHHVGAHVMGSCLDVARHGGGIRHGDLSRVDLAFGRLIHHRGQEIPLVGEMIRRRHPCEWVPGDRVAIPVEESLAQLTARVPGVWRLVHVDVGDRSDDTNGATQVRRGRSLGARRHGHGTSPFAMRTLRPNVVTRRRQALLRHSADPAPQCLRPRREHPRHCHPRRWATLLRRA